MKWFLGVVAGLFFPLALLRADPAADLYNQGLAALNNGDFTTATQNFDQIIANYPSTPAIHDVQVQDGYAYLHLGNYAKTVEVLAKETAAGAPSQGTALFYTGLAQLEIGNKATTPADRNAAFAQAAATMTKLINAITSAPTPENRDYLEEALYNRALAYFYQDDLPHAEADIRQLLHSFNTSLSRADYELLLGNLYARETSEALDKKKASDSDDPIRTLAGQAIESFDQTVNDPNALIQANEARLAKAEVLYMTASLDLPSLAGYQKALDTYREVQRKADLVPLEEQHLKDLTASSQAQLQNAQGSMTVAARNSRVLERETALLAGMKNGPDPVIQALIGIAQCYNSMQQGDEARTVLNRFAHATLTKEQQQAVDFALIYSYVLGGETTAANKALDDYLAKHPGDPQAAGLSVQMAGDLIKAKDYKGALAQTERSLRDFPQGAYAAAAVELKAQALHYLGQENEAKEVEDDYMRQHPGNSVALGLLLTRAQGETESNDLDAALADYGQVKDNAAGSAEIQASGELGYIQTLQLLNRNDDVIQESKSFAAKYPNSPLLPNVLVLGAMAMDKKHDPAAIKALQDVAQKYSSNDDNSPAPFALYYIVTIYQRTGNVPAMIQAADDLAKAFPTRYPLLLQAADAVSTAYVKQKKFDLAIAEYQPLTNAPQADIAATARTKIGDLWLEAAKSLGAYQSMQEEAQRSEAEKRLASAGQAFLDVLKNAPDQLDAVDHAFHGLDEILLQRRSWGLLKDADFEDYLTKLTSGLADSGMETRVELAKAGLVFIEKDGASRYPAALTRFRAALAANPALALTRTESNRYGELLLVAKDYVTARQVYTKLLASNPKDPYTQADGDYGMGASYFAEGTILKAKEYFEKMKALPNGAAWNKHSLDADYVLALAAEQSGQSTDLDTAKQTYARLMQSPQASVELQAKAMLGYGDVLAKQGHTTKPVAPGSLESAVSYYQQVDTLFGPAVPELSAEGLYQAGQLYGQAGDQADAQKMYQTLLKNYQSTAPDWAAKALSAH